MPWWDHPDRPKNFIEIQRSEGYDDDDIAMHYPSTIEEAIEALTGNYFGKALAKHNQFTDGQKGYLEYDDDGDIRFEPSKHGILEVWEEPDQVGWRNLHVIFSDVSEGLGQTSSVAYVFNRDKRKFVAKLKSSKIAADLWADELIKLAKWCGDTPLLCPEVSGAGQTTLKVLRRERYPRIYRDRQEDKVRKKVTTTYGWAESRKKKVLLVDALKGYLRDSETPVPDGELIDQCSTFIRHPDGRLAKEDETKRDDCVIAAGGCLVLDETLPAPERTMTERDIVIATSLSVTKIPWANQEGSRDPWVE
uniref:Terminase n=1 Tax=viral metagenome TaxID=1070528 RepID=A0A6M3IGN4_9ZZZZ